MKKIFIDSKKCTGCRTCEVICSLTHNKGEINPRLSRIRVYRDEVEGILTPIILGPGTRFAYREKPQFLLEGKDNNIDILFRLLRDTSQQCTMCGSCSSWCVTGALTIKED
jgi:benzoyl-CoA reductase subunit BamC